MSKKMKWMVAMPTFLIISTVFLFSQFALAKGKWQVGPHYGIWTLSPVESMIEDFIADTLESELQGLLEEMVEEFAPDWEYTDLTFHPDIHFGSGGTNLGLEVRFYPGGEDGSFSIGLAVEKSELELTLDGSIKFEAEGNYVKGSADTRLLLTSTSYLLSLRWDIKPSSRLHPYIGFGAGIGFLKELLLTYDNVIGEVYIASTDTTYTLPVDSGGMDLADLLEYTGFQTIPLPILQLNLGLNFEITNNLRILLDAGIWDGFLVRGGVALRV